MRNDQKWVIRARWLWILLLGPSFPNPNGTFYFMFRWSDRQIEKLITSKGKLFAGLKLCHSVTFKAFACQLSALPPVHLCLLFIILYKLVHHLSFPVLCEFPSFKEKQWSGKQEGGISTPSPADTSHCPVTHRPHVPQGQGWKEKIFQFPKLWLWNILIYVV